MPTVTAGDMPMTCAIAWDLISIPKDQAKRKWNCDQVRREMKAAGLLLRLDEWSVRTWGRMGARYRLDTPDIHMPAGTTPRRIAGKALIADAMLRDCCRAALRHLNIGSDDDAGQ